MNAELCEQSKKKHPTSLPDISKKTSLAVWFGNNCFNTEGAILRYGKLTMMVKHGLELGGNSSCLVEGINKKARRFMPMLEFLDTISKYKFYIAFENSYRCLEYITEKFWLNSLYVGTVPVVWGSRKSDYMRMAPLNSFIHYEDFDSAQALVDYLKYLDKNDTAYLEYFQWRKSYPCDYPLHRKDDEEFPYSSESEYSVFFNTYCNLCRMLRTNNVIHKQIDSLRNHWYFIPHKDECLGP